jgi:hypothetical protein
MGRGGLLKQIRAAEHIVLFALQTVVIDVALDVGLHVLCRHQTNLPSMEACATAHYWARELMMPTPASMP